MKAKVGDNICFIQKYAPQGETEWIFRLVEAPITSIHIGKNGAKAYSKRFRPIDIEELELNTRWLREANGLILVGEPFIDCYDLRERAKRWVEGRGWERQEDRLLQPEEDVEIFNRGRGEGYGKEKAGDDT